MSRRNPDLIDSLLHRAETDARAAGHAWKQQLCRQKRAENWDRNTEPKQQYRNTPRTLRDMNRRRN